MDLLSWLNPMISFIYLTEHILIYSYLIHYICRFKHFISLILHFFLKKHFQIKSSIVMLSPFFWSDIVYFRYPSPILT